MAALTLNDLFAVRALDRAPQSVLQQMLDGMAKPPGALGRIEELALTLGLIQQQLKPAVERPVLLGLRWRPWPDPLGRGGLSVRRDRGHGRYPAGGQGQRQTPSPAWSGPRSR